MFYAVPDRPKQLKETLCIAQTALLEADDGRLGEHIARLQRLINECDVMRPLGPDGKHGDRHTSRCGCDPKDKNRDD